MISDSVASVVDLSRRKAWVVVLFYLLLIIGAAFYVSDHFKMNTDVTSLLDSNVAWRQREIAFSKAFPQRDDILVVVIDGKDAIGTQIAGEKIGAALHAKSDLFKTVRGLDANAFFEQNGLLFLSDTELAQTTEGIIKAQPLLGSLAADPSLRGLFGMVDLSLLGVDAGQAKKEELTPLFNRIHTALSKSLANPQDENAWRYLMAPETPNKFELRRFIVTQPVLDYSALAPGQTATDFIRNFIAQENLEQKYDLNIRLTGPVPLSDEEFSSISEGMGWALVASFALICLLLFMALRSWQLIVPIFIVLMAGLVITTAFALLTVGSLNLISVAFAVMFTGIAVDFGIQFGVRYRDVRFHIEDLGAAMRRTGWVVAVPLLLAALSTAAGFLSFTPTSYRGVAELGLIAGSGMLIAFSLNITLLPALLHFVKPGAEAESIGYKWAAPSDAFLERHRREILLAFAVLFVGALTACTFLRFDFDPLNLKNPNTESVSTALDLLKDSDTSSYTIDILAKDAASADALAKTISALPEVEAAMTLSSFIPERQDEKIAVIQDTANLLSVLLHPTQVKPAPSIAALKQAAIATAEKLKNVDAALAADLGQFAALDDAQITAITMIFQGTVQKTLVELNARLAQKQITRADIPDTIKQEWVTKDGQERIEVKPKPKPGGDVRDTDTIIRFYDAIKKIAPEATGAPISIQESANTIKRAFVEAAIYSVIIIFLLLWIVLRKIRDTLFVLAPLILACVLTLGTAAMIHLPINFANIIALPLLLGLGVSYSIYFVVYWRQGHDQPLQSSMAKAVLFSAATALVAFGSLSLSNHPGTASMGLLLTLSLFYVLFTTMFFLPVLLGKPVKQATKASLP
ncbi:MAG: hopanoid biosynthesis-associated RND transporter HpnN [Alphaproteobacteria bacterium]|nr:hopanoid biosynthesis-associated RND transporter HpnN [Alphaproteobacteria bacterium]